jgi:hypothetical protein
VSGDSADLRFSTAKGHASLHAEAGVGIRLVVGNDPPRTLTEASVERALGDGEPGVDRLLDEIESHTDALMHQERSLVFAWLRDWQVRQLG